MGASRSTRSLALLSLALGCASQEAVAPEVAAPSIAVDGGAGAQAALLRRIGAGDARAQQCFSRARTSSAGEPDAPCIDGARAACARRCSEGEASACRRLGSSFAVEDKGCAEKLFELACTHGEHGACVSLALLLDGAKEGARIAQLLSQSCQAGHGPGCTRLGARVLDDGDHARGADLLLKGCTKGDAEGCRRAAALSEGEEHVALVRKACNLGDALACVELAGLTKDPAASQQLLQQVCALDTDDDRGQACFLLARMLRQAGAGTQSEALHQRACDKGQMDACIHVARDHYQAGRYQEAIQVVTKPIDESGSNVITREIRGMSAFHLGRFSDAVGDLEHMCRLRPEYVYCHLWLFAARERSGGDGKSGLAAGAKGIDQGHWPGLIVRFFLGKMGEAELIRAARHKERQKELEQLCEAYFYAAQQRMIRGQTKEAAALFQKSIDTGVTNFYEYGLSRSELAKLRP